MTSEDLAQIFNSEEFGQMLQVVVEASLIQIEAKFNARINGMDAVAIQTEVARRFNGLTADVNSTLKGFDARVKVIENANPDKGTVQKFADALADMAYIARVAQ